ncbi:MAG TPA: SDR family oxidoreductase [Pseudorhodoferax sp.]|nr:SDR family oxidoreductase [Pseudorhodoferax sp.]
MTASLQGRVAWIHGAGGALGRAIAAELAGRGARVVLSGRDAARLHAAADALPLAGRDAALVLPADVRDDAAVRATLAQLLQQAGRLDFLVNSTTLPLFGDLLALDDAAWHAVLDTKILGYVRTLRAVLPHLAQQGHGAVVNITGRGGRQPHAVHLPGGAANAAVNLITKGLADQYGPRGVRVNAVAPGPIRSERLDALAQAGGSTATAAGEPADIAQAVAFLLSDAARHINGTVLAVDGGSLATV